MSDRTASTFQRGQQQAQAQRNTEDTVKAVARVFDSDVERYRKMLPSHVNLDDFRNAFLTSVQRNPRLLEADRPSFWLALQQAASDGLKCDSREAALVIFSDTEEEDEDGNKIVKPANKGKIKQVVYMPMVSGLRKLLRNTGAVKTIETDLIYKGEVVEIWRQNGERHFRHVVNTGMDSNRIDDNIIGAYAIVTFKDGSWQAEWMSRVEIEKVRRVSRAKSGAAPWQAWYSEMARKTPLRRLIKQLDKSPEIENIDKALDNDPTLGETIDGEAVEISDALAAPPAETRQQTTTRSRASAKDKDKPPADTSTPTGTPPTQDEEDWRQEAQQGQNAPGQSVPGDQQQKPPAATTNGSTPPSGTTASTTTGTTKTATSQAAPSTTASQAKPGPANEGFEAWLYDEDGVQTREAAYTNALQFANAVAAVCAGKTRPEIDDIFAANQASIEDCYAASESGGRILDAIVQPEAPADTNEPAEIEGSVVQGDDPPFETQAQAEAQAPAEPPPPKVWDVLEVPKLAKGTPNWSAYIGAAKAQLDQFTSAEDATAWLEVQKPTFIPRNIQSETQILRHYKALMEKLVVAKAPDADRQRADAYISEINAQTDGATLSEMAARGDIIADFEAWETARPELFTEVRAAATSRLQFLAGQP